MIFSPLYTHRQNAVSGDTTPVSYTAKQIYLRLSLASISLSLSLCTYVYFAGCVLSSHLPLFFVWLNVNRYSKDGFRFFNMSSHHTHTRVSYTE